MASYNINQREPLLDSNLSALVQKRGRELVGLCLLVLAFLFAVMLGSYTPEDPGWMAASDEPVRNSLGRAGATLAAPLMVILGWASWTLVLFTAVWGLRLVLARGHEALIARSVFLPIAMAVVSVWCATLVPGESWQPVTGLGGVFGDTVLGAVVNALPMSAGAGVRFMSIVMLGATVVIMGHVLGVSLREMRRFTTFFLSGIVLLYAGIVVLLRGGLGQGVKGAQRASGAMLDHARQKAHARAMQREAAMAPPHAQDWQEPQLSAAPVAQRRAPPVIRATPPLSDPQLAAQRPMSAPHVPAQPVSHYAEEDDFAERPNLLSRLKSLNARPAPMPEPELIEPPLTQNAAAAHAPEGEHIRSRIADAIRHRRPSKPVFQFDRDRRPAEPRLSAPAHPQPTALDAEQKAAPFAQDQRFAAQLSANLSPDMPPVPMPDWMLAATPAPAPRVAVPSAAEPSVAESPMPPPRAAAHVLQRRVVASAGRKQQPSRQAKAEAEPAFRFDQDVPGFELPPLGLLQNPSEVERFTLSDDALEENARMLEAVLDDYGVRGEIVSVRPGPVVTQYELEPAPGLKASRVIGLADDIARSMSALSARVSTVPGRSIIGIELPNAHREKVVLREILAARDFGDSNMRLPLALGKGIDGEPIVANLAKMPHLLIAGTTGSGKSVAINTMILSLLYRLSPDECRMIMIDPKMLELSVYDGIPHLLSPVVTDPKKAVVALKWVVGEMEERYRKMSKMGVRNIDGYNGRVREALAAGEMFKRTIQTGFDDETGDPVFETEEFAPELLPFIVVVVDEMADLMMVAGKEIEACIQRLAQMARASGIHLIMATQRPSVDVITGTIKANFPTRISFQVTSKIDSRTILGEQGAEQLLGMGDMLYMAGGGRVNRIHGPFVSDEEVEEVVTHLKSFGPPDYKSGVVEGPESYKEADIDAVLGLGGNTNGEDALYDQAVQVIIQDRKCSTSYIQRKLGIGYNKAARLVEQMEDEGLVTSANHVGKREILVPEQG
ncbi:DNA translocase FtsK 4TM domain-containing protein [Roseibaca sp. V10]|uniref:DNA translocase FtsK n=1 Tax=Roseinatronobacter domitianus TaxID=2940293 RepID=A0ABT0LYJ5_9RHOB|nr:DNA translocase FtsK [Roseibaca domitiana]MCL1627692.1 DNA translocase FtsK 4TM domain-containing protein [Roseibaca domitiana]